MGIAMGLRKSKAQGTKQFAVEPPVGDPMADAADGVNLFSAIAPDEAVLRSRRPGRQSVEELKGASIGRRTRSMTKI